MKYVKLLSQNSFWMVNKHLAKYLKSNDAALLVSHFLSLQEEAFDGKPFYQQQSRILDELNIKLTSLRKLVSLLQSKNLLSVEKKGLPAKHYYFINKQELHRVISLDLPKSAPQEEPHSTSQRKEKEKKKKDKEKKIYKEDVLYTFDKTFV